METKTFNERYNELFQQIENRLEKLINWIGEPSDYVSEPCLKIKSDASIYDEICYLHGKLLLIDQNGLQYSLSVMDFETLCQITDKLSYINPYARDAKKRPLRHLAESNIDLSPFANFSATGSPEGMKKQAYGKGALLVQFGKYIYNVTSEPEIYFEHSEESDQDY